MVFVPKARPVPKLLRMELVHNLLEGSFESRSEKDRVYQARIILDSSFLCSCNGSIMRDAVCDHMKELLNNLSEDELRAWIIDAQSIPPPLVPEDP